MQSFTELSIYIYLKNLLPRFILLKLYYVVDICNYVYQRIMTINMITETELICLLISIGINVIFQDVMADSHYISDKVGA